MRKLILSILFLMGSAVMAQSNFIYVHFDNTQANSSAVVNQISKIIAGTKGDFVVFYTNGESPIICDTIKEWEELRNLMLTQQNAPEFYPEVEFVTVNNLFTKYFKEKVTLGSSLSINGKDDNKWTCTFVISESMLKNELFSDYYSRLFAVNQLYDRMAVNVYAYNNEGIASVGYEKLSKNSLFIYY